MIAFTLHPYLWQLLFNIIQKILNSKLQHLIFQLIYSCITRYWGYFPKKIIIKGRKRKQILIKKVELKKSLKHHFHGNVVPWSWPISMFPQMLMKNVYMCRDLYFLSNYYVISYNVTNYLFNHVKICTKWINFFLYSLITCLYAAQQRSSYVYLFLQKITD